MKVLSTPVSFSITKISQPTVAASNFPEPMFSLTPRELLQRLMCALTMGIKNGWQRTLCVPKLIQRRKTILHFLMSRLNSVPYSYFQTSFNFHSSPTHHLLPVSLSSCPKIPALPVMDLHQPPHLFRVRKRREKYVDHDQGPADGPVSTEVCKPIVEVPRELAPVSGGAVKKEDEHQGVKNCWQAIEFIVGWWMCDRDLLTINGVVVPWYFEDSHCGLSSSYDIVHCEL